MISEGLCDTDNWNNDAENAGLITGRAVRYISDGRNKKSIVSYYVLSFISWCRKIHCLRYFFIIWMTAIFTCHHGAWRGDRTRWRTTRTKRGTTSVAWACVFNHCSFKTTDFKLLKRKQQSYVCCLSVSVWEDRAFFFCRFIGFERLHKHTYASESPSLQVSS